MDLTFRKSALEQPAVSYQRVYMAISDAILHINSVLCLGVLAWLWRRQDSATLSMKNRNSGTKAVPGETGVKGLQDEPSQVSPTRGVEQGSARRCQALLSIIHS